MRDDKPDSEFVKSAPVHYVVRSELESFTDREIHHLRELVERTAAGDAKALELQRTEYLRRLTELNHAHELAAEAVLKTIPRETFEIFVTTQNKWREEVMADSISMKASAATRDRMIYIFMSILGALVSIIGLWAAFRSK